MADELVTLKTRVPRSVANRLARLARQRDPVQASVAAELRLAIDTHLTNNATPRKDGPK